MNNLRVVINYISSSSYAITYLDLVNFCITENLLLTLRIYNDLIFRVLEEHNKYFSFYDSSNHNDNFI